MGEEQVLLCPAREDKSNSNTGREPSPRTIDMFSFIFLEQVRRSRAGWTWLNLRKNNDCFFLQIILLK